MNIGNKARVFLGGALLSLSTASFAIPVIDVTGVTGIWTSATLDNGAVISGLNTNEIRWGRPATADGASGYRFVGNAPSGPWNANEEFSLGVFTHLNFPVFPPTLLDAELTVTIDATITDGADVGMFDITSVFSFTHLETPNNGNPCAAGGAQPCPDLVSAVSNPTATVPVVVGGVEYIVDVSGFQVGGVTFNDFLTSEGVANDANLIAVFREPTADPVPAPASIALMGLGFALFGFGRKRRIKTA